MKNLADTAQVTEVEQHDARRRGGDHRDRDVECVRSTRVLRRDDIGGAGHRLGGSAADHTRGGVQPEAGQEGSGSTDQVTAAPPVLDGTRLTGTPVMKLCACS